MRSTDVALRSNWWTWYRFHNLQQMKWLTENDEQAWKKKKIAIMFV